MGTDPAAPTAGRRRRCHQRAGRSAHAHRHFEHVVRQPPQSAAAFGAQQLRIGRRQRIALQLNIQIVLDGERDGIRQRKINVARAQQLPDERRVRQIHGRDGMLHVGLRQPVEYFRRVTRRREQEQTEKYGADLFHADLVHDEFGSKHTAGEAGHACVFFQSTRDKGSARASASVWVRFQRPRTGTG